MSYLSGLGTTINDLPRGGVNLRLYAKLPDGTFGTGHYNACQPGGPCNPATIDPKGFKTWDLMSSYAGARGEWLVLVDISDLVALCGCDPDGVGCSGTPNYPASFRCTPATPQQVVPQAAPIAVQPAPSVDTTITGTAIVSRGGSGGSGGSGFPSSSGGYVPGLPSIDQGMPGAAPVPGETQSSFNLYVVLGIIGAIVLLRR